MSKGIILWGFLLLQLQSLHGYMASPQNLALSKNTTQSSVCHNGKPEYAVDGNKNPRYWDRSCTHTCSRRKETAWWQVDLECNYYITHVNITNRDSYETRLKNLRIESGDGKQMLNSTLCTHFTKNDIGPSETRQLDCDSPSFGRFVRITLLAENVPLTMCEVEIYGFQSTKSSCLSQTSESSETATTVQTSQDSCMTPCTCIKVLVENTTLTEQLNLLRKQLTVLKNGTSLYKRRLTSAGDSRKSSAVLGGIGVIILSGVFFLILLCDAPRVFKCLSKKNRVRNGSIL